MSLSSTKSSKKGVLKERLKAAFKYNEGQSVRDMETHLENLCTRLADAIIETHFEWLAEAKKNVTTITTASAGTWVSENEPVGGSGLEIGE